jgi:hypothetical protein
MELLSAGSHCLKLIKKYWFLSGLFAVCILTLADGNGILAALGRWLKQNYGPDLVIVFIFLFSGFAFSTKQLMDGH